MKIALKLSVLSAALLAFATPAHALVILPPPIATRVAQSTTVVVGKVESIEEKTIQAKRFPMDTEKGEYQIAVIKIDDAILGAKGLTHVRVGFVPEPTGRPIIRPGGARPVSFAKDQEVLVFLQPHFDGNFLFAPFVYDVVNKQGNQTFEKDVTAAKLYAKMLAEPMTALKAEKLEDRYAAAAVVLQHYRFKRNGTEPKTEAVDADMSKLILTALLEAQGTNAATSIPRLTPESLFEHLGLTATDGWTPPMKELMGNTVIDFEKQPEAIKQWLKDNAGKYRIQRYVYDKAEKGDK
jgi:hypothetical protein